MMINRRLIGMVGQSKRYVAANVALQWCALAANMAMIGMICRLLERLSRGAAEPDDLLLTALTAAVSAAVRFLCSLGSARMAYLSGRAVKGTLREAIFAKLLRLGSAYREQVQTSEAVQVAVEGVEQLETYFGAYLPQFFYAMLAPLTLFLALCFVNVPAALVLLVCVPLIPAAIAAVQTWAKKLLGQYWDQYTTLGDTFLENLQGLTTLKIYQADGFRHREMNEQSERFRRITMKVLSMQLNSITIMDLVAYGGAAAGMVTAVLQLRTGRVGLGGCLAIILLAADFFIPMRQLGSFFHVAMNGMAASEKMFRLLDMPEPQEKTRPVPQRCAIRCEGLRFAYGPEREILRGLDMAFPEGSFTAIVGESGCGKSTVASILMGRNRPTGGRVTVGGVPLEEIAEKSLLRSFTYVSHQSALFKGTVRDNLRMGNPDADDAQMWAALERANLAGFLREADGLDTTLDEQAGNLSGGQRQRLALARALLHDSPVFIFDEATSNVDVESENDIMREIHALARRRTVILIAHRLESVKDADSIYVMDGGCVAERGTHEALLAQGGRYAALWNAQQELENYGRKVMA